ncbi:hypothetical protein CH282_26215 [Rhodococcus sp. 06-418-1B]|nr:hypothetical protein [Rhodococcus sp. 06-418-1B]OZC76375.1 hypothetical protein CH282_26215 [Rhodococcus sp. 06-418-1B]
MANTFGELGSAHIGKRIECGVSGNTTGLWWVDGTLLGVTHQESKTKVLVELVDNQDVQFEVDSDLPIQTRVR